MPRKSKSTQKTKTIDYSKTLALLDAIDAHNITEVNSLINEGLDINLAAPNGETALMVAAKNGHTDILVQLLEAGADANVVAPYDTPLMAAARMGHVEVVTKLLEVGADANLAPRNSDYTPLMAAARGGYVEVVTKLLAAGANANLTTDTGYTALLYVLIDGKKDIEVVTKLLEAGADVDYAPPQGYFSGYTARMLAAEDGNIGTEVITKFLEADATQNDYIKVADNEGKRYNRVPSTRRKLLGMEETAETLPSNSANNRLTPTGHNILVGIAGVLARSFEFLSSIASSKPESPLGDDIFYDARETSEGFSVYCTTDEPPCRYGDGTTNIAPGTGSGNIPDDAVMGECKFPPASESSPQSPALAEQLRSAADANALTSFACTFVETGMARSGFSKEHIEDVSLLIRGSILAYQTGTAYSLVASTILTRGLIDAGLSSGTAANISTAVTLACSAYMYCPLTPTGAVTFAGTVLSGVIASDWTTQEMEKTVEFVDGLKDPKEAQSWGGAVLSREKVQHYTAVAA